jgi:hypothetical protein
MKTDYSSDKTSAPQSAHSPKDENFRVEYEVRAFAGNETAFRLVGGYDIPLGMVHEHLHSTRNGSEIIFENSLMLAMKIATTDFIEKRFRLGREKDSTNPVKDTSLEQDGIIPTVIDKSVLRGPPLDDPRFHNPTPEAPQMQVVRDDLFRRSPVGPGIPNPGPEVQRQPASGSRVAPLPGEESHKKAA